MGRVNVVDPYSGVTLDVDEDSPQARLWGGRVGQPAPGQPDELDAPSGGAPAEEAPAEPKRKPGRPKKSD